MRVFLIIVFLFPCAVQAQLVPSDSAYQKLEKALVSYEKAAKKQQSWPLVPKITKKLEKGYQGDEIAALRKRLQASGELHKKKTNDKNLFDEDVVAALKVFQKNHGLNPDGVFGPNTVDALNQSAEYRIAQIKVNLERFKTMPKEWGKKFVLVNIPDYKVRIFENDKEKLTVRSIVGNPEWKTPLFSDEVEFVVINPEWHVPINIVKKEMLGQIQKDPKYLQNKNFKVSKNIDGKTTLVDPGSVDWSQAKPGDYHFSQRSGGGNSLGRLKFLFPNKHDIYMHDTPGKALFDRDIRAFSHGCVRVDEPLKLADYFLGFTEQKWDAEKIKKAIASGQTQTIKLGEKIPIHIIYVTSWVDEDGVLQFRKDVYGFDRTADK